MATTTADLWSADTIRELVTEPLFQQSVILNSGLTRISTSATKTYIPTVHGGTAAWHVELEELTDAAVDASEVEVTPRKVGCLQLMSNEAVNDAAAASIIGRALVAALADKVDHSFFVGDAPKGPSGLAGAGTAITAVPGDPDAGVDAYVDGVSAIESVGAQASVIFMHPTTWATLSKVKQTAGDARPVLNPQPTQAGDRSLLGLPVRVSKHVPLTTSYVMDASRVVVVDRQPGSVEVDRSAAFTKDGTYVRAIQRIEFAFPEAGVIAEIEAAA
jgi:HK97 family phage major capsid protein